MKECEYEVTHILWQDLADLGKSVCICFELAFGSLYLPVDVIFSAHPLLT